MKSCKQQSGFSLFMVMIIMLVIALLVVVTSQSSSTEMRMSTNDADRKYALSLAENGLRDAENYIGQMPAAIEKGAKYKFSNNCENGLCRPTESVYTITKTSGFELDDPDNTSNKQLTPAHQRTVNKQSIFDVKNRYRCADGTTCKIRYIIEFLGERSEGSSIARYFRITSRAVGDNPNTVVTLESHVEMVNTK